MSDCHDSFHMHNVNSLHMNSMWPGVEYFMVMDYILRYLDKNLPIANVKIESWLRREITSLHVMICETISMVNHNHF